MSRVEDLFATEKNKKFLLESLEYVFANHDDQLDIIEANFNDFFASASRRIASAAIYSDPLPFFSLADQLAMHNKKFIKDVSGFIVSLNRPVVDNFSIDESGETHEAGNGGAPTTTAQGAPDDILNKWRRCSKRGASLREDPSKDYYSGDTNEPEEIYAVNFCDQSADNTQQHLMWLQSGYRDTFNKPADATEPFGNGSRSSTDRLFNRRIFRTEQGIENGIPRRQIKNRHHDRTAARETMTGIERATVPRGYNMSSLYKLVDAKAAYKKCGGPLA